MGAWGHRAFENDDALDFVAALLDRDEPALLTDVLEHLLALPAPEREAPDCAMALAAAEILAAARGQPPADLPAEVPPWLATLEAPTQRTLDAAAEVVERIAADSELRALWAETEELQVWLDSLSELQLRLTV